jgi:hypothetical protein
MWRGNRDRLHFPLSAKQQQQQWTKRTMGKQAKSTPKEVEIGSSWGGMLGLCSSEL